MNRQQHQVIIQEMGFKRSPGVYGNALCEDSLKLAYQGFRSKEKSFNATFEKHFDPTPPQILAIPQYISQVMLHLIGIAFYAVNNKYLDRVATLVHEPNGKPHTPGSPVMLLEIPGYNPLVNVITQNLGIQIKISVTDNGMSIPAAMIAKIFQPFFSTKPTGEGTGLGLSMAYDIITKAHGGKLLVKSTEGVGTDFEIVLPVSSS